MGDWIGLGIIALVAVGALAGLSHLGKKPKPLSKEEYEKRVADGRGLASASAFSGLYALNKLLNPKGVEAVEVQRDLKAGYYDDQEEEGGPGEPGAEGKRPGPTDERGGDA